VLFTEPVLFTESSPISTRKVPYFNIANRTASQKCYKSSHKRKLCLVKQTTAVKDRTTKNIAIHCLSLFVTTVPNRIAIGMVDCIPEKMSENFSGINMAETRI
jgi:hypothetical protein